MAMTAIEHARMLIHKRHPRLAYPRAVRREPKLRQLRLRRERRRGVGPPQPGEVLLVLMVMRLRLWVRVHLRERLWMLVLVRVLMLMLVLVWMWRVMGGRGRSQGCGRRGRLGRRRVLVRRGHVLRERRHGLERVLRLVVLRLLGRRVAVLLVVVRRVCERGRGRMRVVADVFLLAREPFAQHRLPWPRSLALCGGGLSVGGGRRVRREVHHARCCWRSHGR